MEGLSSAYPLPLVLAGPILRHVTPDSVTVWFASSRQLFLELHVYDAAGNRLGCSQPPDSPVAYQTSLAEPLQTSVMLGENLWITLVEARPDRVGTPFPQDQLLTYDLTNTANRQPLDLEDVCLAGETRPGFYIPSQLGQIAYGSCRKPHGPSIGDDRSVQKADSLALLARHLATNKTNFSERPALLFLVGDQIYADDVLPPLMHFVQDMAVNLLGKDIPLPDIGHISHLDTHGRMRLKKELGFTSSSNNPQVLTFGEYAVLYLVTLGNRLDFRFDEGENGNADERSLYAFINSQAEVRKTFANIPTYMNFDDHDITDDWNLCRSWYDRIRSSSASTRVISNALAAYWAFQGWGNAPATYPETFRNTIMAHLLDPADEQKAEAFDFHTWKFRRWSFVLETSPPIFVMDSRTQRDFGTHNQAPQLMDRYALDGMREEWINLLRRQKIESPQTVTPLFITGTPVFGFSSIEWLQYFLYRLGLLSGNLFRVFSASGLDVESWIANRRGFSFFLDTLLLRMGLRKAAFLSGDVHYSFVNRATYINRSNVLKPQSDSNDWNQPPTLECLQLTSSALRNTPGASRYMETFLANWAVKRKHGHCSPETLPWWERWGLWRLFRYDTWTMKAWGIAGRPLQPVSLPWWRYLLIWRVLKVENGKISLRTDLNWITSRPNVALVYLRAGEVVKQVLVSGDEGEHWLVYDIPKIDTGKEQNK